MPAQGMMLNANLPCKFILPNNMGEYLKFALKEFLVVNAW